jgi:hypothetical protein
MKKFSSSVLAFILLFTVLSGCVTSGFDNTEMPSNPLSTPAPVPTLPPRAAQEPTPAPVSEPAVETAPPAAQSTDTEAAIKTGLGIATTISASNASNVQVDSTMVAVTLDENNIITKLSIDAAQTRVPFDAAGQLTADITAAVPSKYEKLYAYNMLGSSDISKEWFEQADAFEAWCIGKSADRVIGMSTYARDEAHPAVPDEPDLVASVTISVGGFIDAVAKAVANAKPATVTGDYKTGLGIYTLADTSRGASANGNGQVQVTSNTVAVTVDSTGTVVSMSFDNAYTTVPFNNTGEIVSVPNPVLSKYEMRDSYNMRDSSAIALEWFEQIDGFCEWAVGKTISGVSTTPLDTGSKPTDPDLVASTTINIGDFLPAVVKAAENLQ